MESTCRWKPSRVQLLGPLLVACLHCAIASATQAAEGDMPAPPASVAATELRRIDRSANRSNVGDAVLACPAPAFEQEPLRDLIDKYAPSALEWSLLPHIAASSRRHHPRNAAAGDPA